MSFYDLKERIFKQNTNFTITLSNPNLRGKIIYPLCDGDPVSWQRLGLTAGRFESHRHSVGAFSGSRVSQPSLGKEGPTGALS